MNGPEPICLRGHSASRPFGEVLMLRFALASMVGTLQWDACILTAIPPHESQSKSSQVSDEHLTARSDAEQPLA